MAEQPLPFEGESTLDIRKRLVAEMMAEHAAGRLVGWDGATIADHKAALKRAKAEIELHQAEIERLKAEIELHQAEIERLKALQR